MTTGFCCFVFSVPCSSVSSDRNELLRSWPTDLKQKNSGKNLLHKHNLLNGDAGAHRGKHQIGKELKIEKTLAAQILIKLCELLLLSVPRLGKVSLGFYI